MDPGTTIPACCQAVESGFDWKTGLSVISALIACGALWITRKSARAAEASAEANLTAMDREEGKLRAPVLLKQLQEQARTSLTDLRSPWRASLKVTGRPEYFALLFLQQEGKLLRVEPEPKVGINVTAKLDRDEESLIARAYQIVELLGGTYPGFRDERFLHIQRFTDIDQAHAMELARQRWRMGTDGSYFAAKIRSRAQTLSDVTIEANGRRFRARTMRPHRRAKREWTTEWIEFGEFDMSGADLRALQDDREIEIEEVSPVTK